MASKRGLSPVITTILLVLLAIILAVIIFLWARGFINDELVKFGEPIERACEKINVEAAISGTSLLITNKGDVPIYKLKIVSSSAGSSSTQAISVPINPGDSKTIAVSASSESRIVSIILGTSKDGKTLDYECPKQYWLEIQ